MSKVFWNQAVCDFFAAAMMAENEMQDSVKEVNDVNLEGEPITETVIEVNDVESRKPVQENVIEDKIDTGRYERSLTILVLLITVVLTV